MFNLWGQLVKEALKKTDIVQFNILYSGTEFNEILYKFEGKVKAGKEVIGKYYRGKKILELSVVSEDKHFEELHNFKYWYNKPIEDPSFWIGDNEILACITHEDLVMIDMEYFGDMISDDISLYDLPPIVEAENE